MNTIKRIVKIFFIMVFVGVIMFGFQGVINANPKNKYILEMRYVGWDKECEPFECYKQGKNYIEEGEKIKLPFLGEVIMDKKITGINLAINDDDIFEDINLKISRCKKSCHMPGCDLILDVIFKNLNICK